MAKYWDADPPLIRLGIFLRKTRLKTSRRSFSRCAESAPHNSQGSPRDGGFHFPQATSHLAEQGDGEGAAVVYELVFADVVEQHREPAGRHPAVGREGGDGALAEAAFGVQPASHDGELALGVGVRGAAGELAGLALRSADVRFNEGLFVLLYNRNKTVAAARQRLDELVDMGRAGRFVANMWSCLAGFIEPGESIEEAARRETLEEAGIVCGRVKYFASQPWPFPMSLMIGCHARATNSDIKVDREELEDARWFTRDETALMFVGQHPDGISIPPPIAIAHHIIRAWVEQGDAVFN